MNEVPFEGVAKMSTPPRIPSNEPLKASSVQHPAKNEEVFKRLKSDASSGDPLLYTQSLSEITRFCSEGRAYYDLAKPEIVEILSIAVQVLKKWKSSAHPIVGALASSLHTFARTLLPFLSEFNNCPHLHGTLNHCFQYLFDRPDSIFVPPAMSAYPGPTAPPPASVTFSTRPTLIPVSLPPTTHSPFNPVAASQPLTSPSTGQSSLSGSAFPGHAGVPTSTYSESAGARGLPNQSSNASTTLAPMDINPLNSIIPTTQSGPELEMSWEDWEALENDEGAPRLNETVDTSSRLDLPPQLKPELRGPSTQEAATLAAPPEIREQSISSVTQVVLHGPEAKLPAVKEGGTVPTVPLAGNQFSSISESANSSHRTQIHIPSKDAPVVAGWGAQDSSQIQTAVSFDAEAPAGEDGAGPHTDFIAHASPQEMELDVPEPALPLGTQTKGSAADLTMVPAETDGASVPESCVAASPSLQTSGSSIPQHPSPQVRRDALNVEKDVETSATPGPNISVPGPEVAREESDDMPISEGEVRNSHLASQAETPQPGETQISLSTSLPGIFAPENLKSELDNVPNGAPTGDPKNDIDTFRELLIPIVAEMHPNADVAQLREQVSGDDLTEIAKLGPAVLEELRATQAVELNNGSYSANVKSPRQLTALKVPEASSTNQPPVLPSPSLSVHDVETLLQTDFESSPDVASNRIPSPGAPRSRLDDQPHGPESDVGQGERKSQNPQPFVGPERVLPRSVVQVLCTLEGSDRLASHSATFELPQEYARSVERWGKRHSNFSPTEEYLSVTLRCFPKPQANGKSEPFEDKWPAQNSLFLTLNKEENPYYLPLTTLCLVSQPICISPLCRAGSNSIQLLQLLDHSDLVFVVRLEKPSSLEMRTYKDMVLDKPPLGLDI